MLTRKTVVVLRSPSGSGKSFLANELCEFCKKAGFSYMICSTDSYFMKDGKFKFDIKLLGINHRKNQDRFSWAIQNKVEVIIVDNTNLTQKECEPYVAEALGHGYKVRLEIPKFEGTVEELAQRNQHGLTVEMIQKQKDKFKSNDDVGKALAEKLKVKYSEGQFNA